MRRLLSMAGGCAVAVALAIPADAAVGASFVLRSGERVSGSLVDMGASGLEVSVGGQTRTWSVGELAVIDFTGGSIVAEQRSGPGRRRAPARAAQRPRFIRGTLSDVGGREPAAHHVFDAAASTATSRPTRSRGSTSPSRVAPRRTGLGTPTDGLAPATGRVRVAGTAGWVNTGLVVSQGQTLLFNTTGEVRLSAASDDVARPRRIEEGPLCARGAVPSVLAGALVGRIGNGAPFAIGNQASIPSPGAGMLWLAVNDDSLGDNAGEFGVDVTAQAHRAANRRGVRLATPAPASVRPRRRASPGSSHRAPAALAVQLPLLCPTGKPR